MPRPQLDVIIAGARCAGSPLAMLLAREGYRVLVVDKARFPSDTVSTHLIWQAGLARAKRWGLLERIVALSAPPIRRGQFDIGEISFGGCPPPLDGIDFALAPRRTLLDKLLVDAARESGAEVREDFYITGVVTENGRVTGIRGRHLGGADVEKRARIVVGADGTHSVIAQAVKAPKYNVQPSSATGYYSYWCGGPQITDFEVYFRDGWAGVAFPTNDGLTCIVGSWNETFLKPAETASAEGVPAVGYRKFMAGIPRLNEFLCSAEQVEPLAGMREFPGFFRKPWGDGWALVGDAGYHKHPLSAQGITDAFRDAERLARAIGDGFSDRRDLAECLADYQRERDQAVIPMYESTCRRALLHAPTPERTALFRALQHNALEADRFFGTEAGTYPITEFFSPHNIERIIRSTADSATA